MDDQSDGPPTDTPAEHEFASVKRTVLLDAVAGAWGQTLRTVLAPFDVTAAQYRLLAAAIRAADGGAAVPQSAVGAAAAMDPATTSETLRTLERRGLLVRVPHPTDRRARAVALTSSGLDLTAKLLAIVSETEARFFDTGMPEFGPLAKALRKGGRGEG